MSVINKMLRDLDQRQVPDDSSMAKPGATPLRSGTASVAGVLIPAGVARSRGPWVPVAIVAAVLAASGGAGWWWTHQAPAIKVVQSNPVPALMATNSVAPAAAPASSPAIALAPVASAAAKPMVSASASVPTITKPVSNAVNNPPPVSVPVGAGSVVTAPALAPVPAAVVTAPAPKPAPVIDTPSTGQRQQQAAREALAQAQTLWNAGAHDNAIDLLQQAVATAERSAQSTPGAPATLALASLARELARMQVAQGRPGASVDMLTRLEPLLSGEPEIWAMRANAAQRAGRHQDSVNAYTIALQSRPNEQRWLLGAAVSSAALGQIANATALTERATSVGPVPKDVQAYLRQMGVSLKD